MDKDIDAFRVRGDGIASRTLVEVWDGREWRKITNVKRLEYKLSELHNPAQLTLVLSGVKLDVAAPAKLEYEK